MSKYSRKDNATFLVVFFLLAIATMPIWLVIVAALAVPVLICVAIIGSVGWMLRGK